MMKSSFERLFEDYAAVFNAFDAEAIAAYYHCPCLMVTDELVAPFTTNEAILDNMRGLLEHHRAQNVGQAAVSDLHVEVQAENLAIARVRWTIDDQEGAPLWSWLNTYNLAEQGSGWKILVSTMHTTHYGLPLIATSALVGR
jgi:ketosteroid isomerase-like protein